jgi:hypothetical protein
MAFALLPRGLARAAFSDIVCALLMLSVLVVTSLNGISSNGRMRVFWILQATGWGLWLLDQLLWIVFDLVLKEQMPEMFSADALLFMAGVPILAGLLLRPHLQPSERSARLGALDFSLLLKRRDERKEWRLPVAFHQLPAEGSAVYDVGSQQELRLQPECQDSRYSLASLH